MGHAELLSATIISGHYAMLVKNYILLVIGTVFCLANGHTQRSSLTFVIDVTDSMLTVIEQVKSTVDNIFDNVINSTTNNIDDFILVTFGDPKADVIIKTRNRQKFKKALQDIQLESGDACPEVSMKAITLALKHSHPNSYLYVFTDASARDYKNVTIVKSLSQKLSTQVNFLLTGKCRAAKNKPYIVYDDIAETTSGHIFNIKKDDVGKIVKYIAENLKSKITVLERKLVADNFNQHIPFTIDSKISNVFICVSSSHPRNISIFNSEGEKIDVTSVVDTDKNFIVKLQNELIGTYFIKLGQNERTLVTVTSSTSICFQYGFSTTQPATMDETSIKPNGDSKEQHYLLIQLVNDEMDFSLELAELVAMNDDILTNLSLTLIDVNDQLYVSDAFDVPDVMFRIAVIGYTESHEKIRRVSIASTQRPNRDVEELEKSGNIAPEINILAGSRIKVDFNKSVSITCKVCAEPKPNITWVDADGLELQAKIIKYDSPYYGSVIRIEKADKGGLLICKASNSEGHAENSIMLEINRNVVESSTVPAPSAYVYEAIVGDLALQIPCNTTSQVSAEVNVKWQYKTGGTETVLSREGTNDYTIDNNGTLILKHIKQKLEGLYKCSFDSDWIEVQIKENPIPTAYELRPTSNLPLGASLSLPCDNREDKYRFNGRARWYKDGYLTKNCTYFSLCTLDLNNVTLDDKGVYMCRISTAERSYTVSRPVNVDLPPSFKNKVETKIPFKENELAFLDCSALSVTTPEINWSIGSRIISKKSTISFNMEISDIGIYKCNVCNEIDCISRTFEIVSDKECHVNVSFHRNMPLFLSTSLEWINSSIKINQRIRIICINSAMSDGKRTFPSIVDASCLENTTFKTKDSDIIDISMLRCDEQIKLSTKILNTKYCFNEPSELMSVGFQIQTGLIGIFDACIDRKKNFTYFIKNTVNINIQNKLPKEYINSQLLAFKSENDLGCKLIGENKCCFVKKQLLSSKDILPGLQQIAAFSEANFVPQWSSCGTENWDEVRRRVRTFSTSLKEPLEILTGTSEFILINDKFGTHYVPLYIWKVLFNKRDSKGVAIIVINIQSEPCKHRCTDVCDKTRWMQSSQWRNASSGCVFCCSLDEFMKVFHYEHIFPRDTKLLID